MTKTLTELYEPYNVADWNLGSDKGSVHSYLQVYEELLKPYRSTARRVLEIGLMGGASLRLWEDYYQSAWVHGADLCDQPHGGLADLRPMLAEGTHHINFLDATDPVRVEHTYLDLKFDVIIEDASHVLEHQLAIYRNFRDRLAPGGLYCIEDVADLDKVRPLFENIDPAREVTILDRRAIKGRFDDVLVVIRDKTPRL